MNEYVVTKREKRSYGLYFMGQNVFFVIFSGYLTTYFTDVGIAAATVAVLMLFTKVWDAINDPIFGALMDKVKFKKGKFVPWLKMSMVAIPLATIMMFAIPSGIPIWGKIAWAAFAYMLWDTAYTICDVPIFGLITTITSNQRERTNLNAYGRLFAMIAGIVVSIIIPLFREAIGGWTMTVVILSVIGAFTMLPICLTAKERVIEEENEKGGEENYSLKDMFRCIKSNKYLLIFFSSSIVASVFSVGSAWGLYIARYCLGSEKLASVTTIVSIVPALVIGALVPVFCKKVDKFKLYYGAVIVSSVIGVIRFVAGYDNLVIYFALSALAAIPGAFTMMLMYQFTPDCYEYGQYKHGYKMRGLTFAAQTFFVKLSGAIATAVSTAALGYIGFIEGENAVQAAGFAHKLWTYSCWGGIIGSVFVLTILYFYKLNDHDVQIMAKCNLGEITREEAEKEMSRSY